MKVIIESPYAGKTAFNVEYARLCMLDSLGKGEAPMLSHLLYTQVLDDNLQEHRKCGIDAGFEWMKVADKVVFYIDLGYSKGMNEAYYKAEQMGKEIEERFIL